MNLPHHDVAIVGSGFAGLGMAIELGRAGREDYVVLERDDALGGTWYANHYPGCACDVPTPYYSFSFAPKPDWSRFYAPHAEIRAYLEQCCDRFGVRPRLRLRSEVTGASWDEPAQRWRVEVNGEPALTARVLVGAPGGLSRPSYPEIDGIGEFAGPWFHSAEWDHSIDLAGSRVAVIGTGASAIQFVPHVAREAAHVDVFQRTPPWVLPKPDRRIGRREQWLYRRLPFAQKLLRFGIWAMQEWMGLGNTVDRRLTKPLEAIGKAHIRRFIDDPELRAKLTPDYAVGCKRLLLENGWYQTLAQPHVELVTDGIERVTANGLITSDGAEHPAEVIVFGTGFLATEPFATLDLQGREGIVLADAWAEIMNAHRGTTISGFPNFFLMPGPNTGTGHTSQVFMIETQIRHVLAALRRMDERGAAVIEPRADAQRAFNERIQRRMEQTVWLRGGCTSWYLDAEGRNVTLWPYGSLRFRRELRRIDEDEYVFQPARRPHRDEVPPAGPATVPLPAGEEVRT